MATVIVGGEVRIAVEVDRRIDGSIVVCIETDVRIPIAIEIFVAERNAINSHEGVIRSCHQIVIIKIEIKDVSKLESCSQVGFVDSIDEAVDFRSAE